MSTEHVTPREGAALFLSFIERYGWRVYLDDQSQMSATIGSDLPQMAQAQILAVLGSLDAEIVGILRGLETEH